MESKVDTIGSKHPFIFRNGNVGYKEFSISGLISLQMDEENLFAKKYLPIKEHRKYKRQYQLVDVVGIEAYYYPEIKNKLYIHLGSKKYFPLVQYCMDYNLTYDEAYE